MLYIELNDESIARALDDPCLKIPGAGVLALLPEAEKARLPLLQSACEAKSLALVGGIFPALLRQEQFVEQGAWLIFFERMPPSFLIPALNEGAPGAAGKIVAEVRAALPSCSADGQKPTLVLFFDAMLPNIASVLEGTYLELSNRVGYAGVNAGSESFQPMPCLFDNTRLIGNGVLGILVPGNISPVLEHGFVQPERAMSATSTEGNRIAMIDWRPAFDVYQEIIKSEYGIELTRDNFYQHAVHFPFGLLRANGDVVVRIPVALADDGSLFCVGEVPENAMLALLKAPARGANDCIQRLLDNLSMVSGPQLGKQLLLFYCAGRRMHLGADAEGELADVKSASAAALVGGALSLGEIGSTSRWGYPMFHNATLICAAWENA